MNPAALKQRTSKEGEPVHTFNLHCNNRGTATMAHKGSAQVKDPCFTTVHHVCICFPAVNPHTSAAPCSESKCFVGLGTRATRDEKRLSEESKLACSFMKFGQVPHVWFAKWVCILVVMLFGAVGSSCGGIVL